MAIWQPPIDYLPDDGSESRQRGNWQLEILTNTQQEVVNFVIMFIINIFIFVILNILFVFWIFLLTCNNISILCPCFHHKKMMHVDMNCFVTVLKIK